MIGEKLSAALERASHALRGDDAIAANGALQEATNACEAALRQGLRLHSDEMGFLRALHRTCAVAAERTRLKLAAALGAAGEARRADAAYRR